MNYRLVNLADPAAPVVVADGSHQSVAAALEWAVAWLEQNACVADHLLEDTSGPFSAKLIRTLGNQWYAIAQPARA